MHPSAAKQGADSLRKARFQVPRGNHLQNQAPPTKKQGQGVETWPNGYIYKGEFKNSVWSGIGTLTFPDGSTYEGEWANGFMNGQGTFTWADGKQKTGIWKNGKLQE